MSGRGQGSVTKNPGSAIPAGSGNVTAANNGLSLSGTTVQLGNASILSALPLLTANRNIPTGGFFIALNSTNIATPVEQNLINQRNIIMNARVGGTAPEIQLLDSTIVNSGGANTISPVSIRLTRTNAGIAIPNLQLNDTAITGRSTLLTSEALTINSGAGPVITVSGLNAAGAVLAARFINTSTAAAATANLQLFLDSNVQDLQIVKHSNAHATFPGGTLIQNLGGAANGQLCLRSNSAGAPAVTIQIGTTETARFISTGLTLGVAGTTRGTLLLAGNTSGVVTIQPQAAAGTYNFNLPIVSGGAGDILTSGGGGAAPMVFVSPATLTGLPYISVNGTSIATGNIILNENTNSIEFGGVASASGIKITNTNTDVGDFNANTNGVFIRVDDAAKLTTFNNSEILTGDPNAVLTTPPVNWALGNTITAAAVFDATRYVEVAINGSLVKLARVT